ncbi:MAG: hypothetical protein ABH811_00715 [archaeon]
MIVDYARKFPFKNNGSYQSDLSLKCKEGESDITIFGSQPIYPTENNDGFELDDNYTARIMCYLPFEYNEIIIHNGMSVEGPFGKRIKSLLDNLKNE